MPLPQIELGHARRLQRENIKMGRRIEEDVATIRQLEHRIHVLESGGPNATQLPTVPATHGVRREDPSYGRPPLQVSEVQDIRNYTGELQAATAE
jgi:hypothetical protein